MKKPGKTLKNCSAGHRLVLVTAPTRATARALAKAALTKRLAACVNLIPRLESHYWWQGKMEHGAEVLMIFKTRTPLLNALERLVSEFHLYDTPEFLVLSVASASNKYLDWWNRETGATVPGNR